MIKYTHSENQNMMAPLSLQAFECGLITADEKLCYEKGGRGTATVIRLVRRDPETQNRHPQMRPQWVPEFGYKDGPSVVGNALVNVSNVLYAVQKQRDEAQRAARLEAPEEAPDNATNNYRRYELSKVDATGEYPAKVKFFSDEGDSKHLNITATEFDQIKNVLLDYRND